MKIISIKESVTKGLVYYIIMTDEREFYCTDEDYIVNSVYDWMDEPPSQDELKEMLSQFNENYYFTTARLAVVKFVSTKIICRRDLYEKLKKLKVKSDIIEKVVKWYCDNNYVNDYDYAKKYVINSMMLKPCSRNKISLELRMKKIPKEAIDAALEQIEETELELCSKVFLVRYSLEQMKDEKLRERAIRYLIGKGFKISDVMKIVKGNLECE